MPLQRPLNPPTPCRCRAQNRSRRDLPAGLGRRPDRAARKTEAGRRTGCKGRAETANAGRHHQRPRLLGRRRRHAETGNPRAGRRPRRPPGARRRRPAIDRQRFRWFQALAYAPAASSPVRPRQYRRGQRADPAQPSPASASAQSDGRHQYHHGRRQGTAGSGQRVTTSTRIAAAKGNDIWMRVMMLAPSASTSMSTTVLGDTDMTLMRGISSSRRPRSR